MRARRPNMAVDWRRGSARIARNRGSGGGVVSRSLETFDAAMALARTRTRAPLTAFDRLPSSSRARTNRRPRGECASARRRTLAHIRAAIVTVASVRSLA